MMCGQPGDKTNLATAGIEIRFNTGNLLPISIDVVTAPNCNCCDKIIANSGAVRVRKKSYVTWTNILDLFRSLYQAITSQSVTNVFGKDSTSDYQVQHTVNPVTRRASRIRRPLKFWALPVALVPPVSSVLWGQTRSTTSRSSLMRSPYDVIFIY